MDTTRLRTFVFNRQRSGKTKCGFWVESRTRIIDAASSQSEDYVQVGSCKSEHTFAKDNLLHEDNYDFLPVFGPEWSVIYRRHANLRDTYRENPPLRGVLERATVPSDCRE